MRKTQQLDLKVENKTGRAALFLNLSKAKIFSDLEKLAKVHSLPMILQNSQCTADGKLAVVVIE